MSFALKKYVVIALLGVSFTWPLVHYGLVQSLQLNPWNWWGWAMYTMPAPRVKARTTSLDTGKDFNPAQTSREHGRRIMQAYNEFSSRQIEMGGLAEPDAFARVLLEAFPTHSGCRIEVWRVELDPETAMLVERKDEGWTYEYRRADVGL